MLTIVAAVDHLTRPRLHLLILRRGIVMLPRLRHQLTYLVLTMIVEESARRPRRPLLDH